MGCRERTLWENLLPSTNSSEVNHKPLICINFGPILGNVKPFIPEKKNTLQALEQHLERFR